MLNVGKEEKTKNLKIMKKFVIIIISIFLFSCNTGINNKKSDKASENKTKSFLTEGEHEVEIDGVKLWYLVKGKGPILIAYPSSGGWGGDCSIYVEYLKPWEETRTVIYLEPRGLGKSERLDSLNNYTMDRYVEELEEFRKKLEIDKFDLYGHCFAGMISMKYALKYGHHLNKMIVMSTWPKLTGNWNDWLSKRNGYEDFLNRYSEIKNKNLSEQDKLKETWKNTYTLTFHDYKKHKENFERIMDETIFSVLPQRQFTTIEHRKYNIADTISNITTETLIIYGDDDFPMAINGSKMIEKKLNNSILVEVKDCCHWAFIEQPDFFFSETINFLNN